MTRLWIKSKNNIFLTKLKSSKNELWAIFANLLGPVAQLAPMFFTFKYISPEDLGTCESIFLAVAYFTFAPLGVFNGLKRNIPIFEGEGSHQKAQSQIATSWAVAHATAGVGALVGLGYVIYFLINDSSYFSFLCSIALMVTLCLTSYGNHIQSIYSGAQFYGKLGSAKMLGNSSVIITAWLPYLIGAPALLVRKIAVTAAPVMIYFMTRKDRYSCKASFSFEHYRNLVSAGFPIMFSGYLSRVLLVADQSIIAVYLDEKSLGFYALSIFLVMAIMQVPRSFLLILYPKAAFAYGKSKNPKAIRRYILMSLLINLCALLPVCMLCYFLLDYIVQYFPKYQGGVACAKIACFTGVAMSYSGASIAFMVLKRNLFYQMILGVGIGLMWLIGSLLIKNGYGIEAIAFTRLGVTGVTALLVIGWAFWLTRSGEGQG